jgi:hypothetical protein
LQGKKYEKIIGSKARCAGSPKKLVQLDNILQGGNEVAWEASAELLCLMGMEKVTPSSISSVIFSPGSTADSSTSSCQILDHCKHNYLIMMVHQHSLSECCEFIWPQQGTNLERVQILILYSLVPYLLTCATARCSGKTRSSS